MHITNFSIAQVLTWISRGAFVINAVSFGMGVTCLGMSIDSANRCGQVGYSYETSICQKQKDLEKLASQLNKSITSVTLLV